MSKKEFEGQLEGEELLFIFRRHVIAMRKGFYGILIFILIGSLIGFVIAMAGGSSNMVLIGLILGSLIGGIYFFLQWITWYFSIFIVTNERIRQSSQTGLFGRSMVDLNLDNIKNISYNIPGFTGELFGFGTIVLQTMVGNMVIHQVDHVDKVYNDLSIAIRRAGGEISRRDVHETNQETENDGQE